jgi:hypothetical protein
MSVPVPQEIHHLSNLTCVRCNEFRHELVVKAFQVANVATPQTIFTFTVPEHQSWFVTEIDLEAYNPAAVGSTPVGAGDFRSDQVDWNGLTNAWITVNGNPIMAANSIASSGVFNRPVLFTFKGGDKVQILVQRSASSLPATAYEIQIAVNGYFAPATAIAQVSPNTTNIQAGA